MQASSRIEQTVPAGEDFANKDIDEVRKAMFSLLKKESSNNGHQP